MSKKIAVTSAFGWPYVRRGNRVVYELAVYLAGRGNEVHFITTKPGEVRRDKVKGNLLIKYFPLMENPLLSRFHIQYYHTFAVTCLNALLKEDYDIVHTSLTLDAFAASLNRALKGTPFIPVLINGDPLYKDAPRARRLFRRAVRKASRLVTISNFVNQILRKDFGVEGTMIPCPLDTSKFFIGEKKATDRPRILCTAALNMERKRVPLLVKAFEILVQRDPNVVLQLAGETTPEFTNKLLLSVNARARESIEVVDIASDEVLASFYRNAAITVLPSLKEPFGMVTTESLASGTPVVGTRSGGTQEILDNEQVGVLFEPSDGPEELSKSLAKGLELARDPQTAKRCSDHAERYSWNTLGPKYEELHSEILNESSRKSRFWQKRMEKGRSSSVLVNEPISFEKTINPSALRKFFRDTLDELEITAQAYYEIESYRPRCIYLLKSILTSGIRDARVLVLSRYPNFLPRLLKKLAFSTRHIIVNNGMDGIDKGADREILQNPECLADLEEQFDVIVCDELFEHLAAAAVTLQILKDRLSPSGVLVLTTPNADCVENRFNLQSSRRIRQSQRLREYSLAEIEKVAINAGFTVLQKSYIMGKKRISKSIAFTYVPLRIYLLQKIYHTLEGVFASLRSHSFLALKAHAQER
jgi:glycosyltransferase involved in cell wall biosynthesis